MQKLNLAALALVTASGLAACGGGGGGSPSVSSSNTPSTGGSTGGTTGGNTGSTSAAGNYIKITAAGAEAPKSLTLKNNSRDTLVVDGKEIALTYPGISAGTFTNLNGNVISGSHLSYARYGVVKVDGNPIVFAQGNLSTDTPPTGKATYKGLSVHVAGSAAPIDGDSRFDVDFGAKKLIGVVGVAGGGIQLSADITGNTFQGTYATGTQTQGAFYGPQAAELSGTYSNKAANYNGAFGAVKQP